MCVYHRLTDWCGGSVCVLLGCLIVCVMVIIMCVIVFDCGVHTD